MNNTVSLCILMKEKTFHLSILAWRCVSVRDVNKPYCMWTPNCRRICRSKSGLCDAFFRVFSLFRAKNSHIEFSISLWPARVCHQNGFLLQKRKCWEMASTSYFSFWFPWLGPKLLLICRNHGHQTGKYDVEAICQPIFRLQLKPIVTAPPNGHGRHCLRSRVRISISHFAAVSRSFCRRRRRRRRHRRQRCFFLFNFNGHLDCNLWNREHIILPLMATNNNNRKKKLRTHYTDLHKTQLHRTNRKSPAPTQWQNLWERRNLILQTKYNSVWRFFEIQESSETWKMRRCDHHRTLTSHSRMKSIFEINFAHRAIINCFTQCAQIDHMKFTQQKRFVISLFILCFSWLVIICAQLSVSEYRRYYDLWFSWIMMMPSMYTALTAHSVRRN